MLQKLINSLKEIQANCHGLFRPHGSDKFELVIENKGGVLKTLSIGNLFGLSSLHIGADQGTYIQFPTGKTLSEMMEDPTGFYHWCLENGINQ